MIHATKPPCVQIYTAHFVACVLTDSLEMELTVMVSTARNVDILYI